MTAARLKAQSFLQGASAMAARGQAPVDIFDLKPQLTATAESKVLRTVRSLEECQVLLTLLHHHQVKGSREDLQCLYLRRREPGCYGPPLGLVVES